MNPPASVPPGRIPYLAAKMTHDLPEEGQLVVYSPEGEKLIVLNEIGAAIYFLIDGKNSPHDIAEFVRQTLRGGEEDAYERDVALFLEQLAAHDIVRWSGAPPSEAPLP